MTAAELRAMLAPFPDDAQVVFRAAGRDFVVGITGAGVWHTPEGYQVLALTNDIEPCRTGDRDVRPHEVWDDGTRMMTPGGRDLTPARPRPRL